MFLKPDYLIDGDITTLDIERLCDDGIKGLIIDLDSTLMAPKTCEITRETEAWLICARNRFKIIVLSNNKRMDYCSSAEKILNMKVIGKAAKPLQAGFQQALNELGLPPEEVAVIGDRPLTDIWGGLRGNMKTVLVRPLSSIIEPSWKTYIRNLEHVFIKR